MGLTSLCSVQRTGSQSRVRQTQTTPAPSQALRLSVWTEYVDRSQLRTIPKSLSWEHDAGY